MQPADGEAVLRDVAARIIQHHYRAKLERRASGARQPRAGANSRGAAGAPSPPPCTPPAPRPGTIDPAGGLDSLDLLLGGGEGSVAGVPPTLPAGAAR